MKIPVERKQIRNGDIIYDRDGAAWEFIGFSGWDTKFFILVKPERVEEMSFGRGLDDGFRVVHVDKLPEFHKDVAYLDVSRQEQKPESNDWVN